MKQDAHLEIECKFLIEPPDEATLAALPAVRRIEIEQRYLLAPKGVSERVRRCTEAGKVRYYHTVKKHLTQLTRSEDEREIDRAAYEALCERADPETGVIRKTRHTFVSDGQVFELDVYRDFDFATLEAEVKSENDLKNVKTPPFLRMIRDVTADSAYSNHALAKRLAEKKADR